MGLFSMSKKKHSQDDPVASAEEVASVEAELAAVVKDRNDVKVEIAKLEEKHREATIDSDLVSSRIAVIGEVEALKSGIDAIDHQLAARETVIQKKETALKVLGGKIDALSEVLEHGPHDQWICDKRTERRGEMERLNSVMKQLYEEKWALIATRDTKQHLLDERRGLFAKLADLNGKCDALAAEESAKKAQLTVSEARFDYLSKQLTELKKEKRVKEESVQLQKSTGSDNGHQDVKEEKTKGGDGKTHKNRAFSFKRLMPAAIGGKKKGVAADRGGNAGQSC